MTTRLLLAAAAATASLAACGSEPAAPQPSREAANRKALLAYARCMREQGVDMPDPTFESGGRVRMSAGSRDADPAMMRAAEKACEKHREAVEPPKLSAKESEEFRKRALEHSRCMREHGANVPDPTFDEDGGAQVRLGRGINPDDPKFQAAQEACEDKLPFGRTNTEEEK